MLKIYKNKTPNQPNGLHYLFTNFQDYLVEMGTPFLQFELDNYRINGGTIEIATSAPYADVDQITYVIDNRDSFNRCYFVDYAEVQSGYLILQIHVDWWASYIYKATLSNLRVTRSNRNVGIGVYDPIQITNRCEFEQIDVTREFSTEDLAIVFTVAFATGSTSILTNTASTSLGIYAINLRDFQETSPIDWALELVSGIYGIEESTTVEKEANVLNAYFIPKDYLPDKKTVVKTFVTNTSKGKYTIRPGYEIAPNIYRVKFNKIINPNFEYYVGTKLSGLKLIRTTEESIEICYEFITKQDGMQVIVRQGAQMLDITNAFSVGLTSNDASYTTSQQIVKSIQSIGGIASGLFQVAKGGAGVVTGTLQVTSAIASAIGEGNAKYSQGGDGVSTFRLPNGTVVDPFYCAKYASGDNEKAHARLFGATFNQQIASLDSLFGFPYLGEGTAETYVALTCQLDGVCMNARDDILAQLKEGVYIKRL